jgi:adenosine kinase
MNIYISGSLAYDRIMDFPGRFEDHILPDKIHILNVCFMVNGLTERFGGTAGNIAYNLTLLDERPLILAALGKDYAPYENRLRQLGLPLTGVRRIDEEFTAGAYITTDLADNQITGFNPGAMRHTSDYRFGAETAADALAIVSPGNLEDMLLYSRRYKEMGVPYIFDPGQSIPALSADDLLEMVTGAHLFVSNDYELELVRRATGLGTVGLLQRCARVVTTLGEKGSQVTTSAGVVTIPALAVEKVLDPTGAGDAYRAGLIKGMVLGRDFLEAARMGSVCASFAIEKQGTQEHRFDAASFQRRFDAAYG